MQKRHTDRRLYFTELANTSREFYLPQILQLLTLTQDTKVLEIGCGDGGNLLPFAQAGCKVIGIDINPINIDNAKRFFQENNQSGQFILSDFLQVPIPTNEDDRYHVILVHDVIEHIEPPHKHDFIELMKQFLRRDGIAFFGFPAWQMPFGGHQQICHTKISRLPWIHLLPPKTYENLLQKAGEPERTINELLSIQRAQLPIEQFEKLITASNLTTLKKTYWFINPHYKQKFNLHPMRVIPPLDKIPHLRNFYTTSAWYLLKHQNTKQVEDMRSL